MQTWLYKNWWVLTLNGIIAILFGIVAVKLPIVTIESLVFYFGLIILLSGIILIFVSLYNLKKKRSWVVWLLEGIFNTAVGIVIISSTEITLNLFLVFFGIWALILGIVQGIIGFNLKEGQSGKQLIFINAVFCIALGIMLFYNPLEKESVFKIITGIIALIAGILVIYFSISLKASSKKQLTEQD